MNFLQLDASVATASKKLAESEKEKTLLSLNLENSNLAKGNDKNAMEQNLQQQQSVFETQIGKMQELVDKLKHENEGLYVKSVSYILYLELIQLVLMFRTHSMS